MFFVAGCEKDDGNKKNNHFYGKYSDGKGSIVEINEHFIDVRLSENMDTYNIHNGEKINYRYIYENKFLSSEYNKSNTSYTLYPTNGTLTTSGYHYLTHQTLFHQPSWGYGTFMINNPNNTIVLNMGKNKIKVQGKIKCEELTSAGFNPLLFNLELYKEN